MVCCIYLLTNKDGYGYIGKTENLKKRLRVHKSNNKCFSKFLGDDKECIILEECDEDCLDDYEQYYYDMYKEMYGDKIVNGRRPLESYQNKIMYHREYKKANRVTISEYEKEYREANREKLKEYRRKRYIELKQLKDKQNK